MKHLNSGDEITRPGTDPLATSPREKRTAVVLFLATLASVYLVYGFQWFGRNPLTDGESAIASAKFAVALMTILLAHEMGHFIVARRHGFSLSLPYFLPFPSAFGTFGAIIRLRSLPANRTALLEMGAAGPLAGFFVAVIVIALGLPGTVEHAVPEMVWTASLADLAAPVAEPGALLLWINNVLSHIVPEVPPGGVQLMIMANPLVMDLLGTLVLGHVPGRYATLDPLATAGWVGCLLTAINLLPIGQLDGGHIFNALAPRFARIVSRVLLGVAFVAGLVWMGWAFWAVILLALGAWVSLPVPNQPPVTRRARWIAVSAGVAFVLSFMPSPLVMESFSLRDLRLVDEAGEPLDPVLIEQINALVDERLAEDAERR